MAPTRNAHPLLGGLSTRNTISTRSKAVTNCGQTKDVARGKRKADHSPSKENKTSKRTAFGDRNVNVNEFLKAKANDEKHKVNVRQYVAVKKVTVQSKTLASVKTVLKPRQNENLAPPPAPGNKIVTRAAVKNVVVPNQTAVKPKEVLKDSNVNKVNKRLSNEFEKTDESLYCTALEDMSPENVQDFDKENWNDIYQVSHYAMDIFNYLKERESTFQIPDYMDRQICLTRWMRSLLVDWMVEIQESFELNHETLYLGVKLVDMYLSKMTVGKETLQLVGAAAMFVASKYDERIPPMIDDFLYICDGAYSRQELIRMEMNLLKICDFNLGIPISYRFLRRYARCAKITMPILTLARFILEYSLMDYSTITIQDSKLASASLYLALRMKKISGWTPTLEFYTGYKLEELMPVVQLLNNGLHKPTKSQLMTVRNKYSHKIFLK
ncbi:hypothetical protein NQ318_019984 [Aromia moschata]|uniref:G2/mitotic-specific cyclin-B3 n=1 Tax=Aromia moschata TaxID=1265417 RepID=A0AAV8Y6N4_9CUCU|nr:hypothetical protein NQ318_019984 [Aromia moschata]